MELEKYYKKGAKVIYHFKEWRRVYYLNHGTHDWVPTWKRATIVCQPRDEHGRFTNNFSYEYDVTVLLKDSDGKVFETTLDKIEPDIAPSTLSEEELTKLWNEISHGSMYYSDYKNSLGVFENVALDFYDGYIDELWYDLKEQFGEKYADEHLCEKECADGFAAYCQSCECIY